METKLTDWETLEELKAQIVKSAKVDETVEIERKWLIDINLIEYLNTLEWDKTTHKYVTAGYLSVDPEIRLRSLRSLSGDDIGKFRYYVSYKTSGELVREEYDVEINAFDAIKLRDRIYLDPKIHTHSSEYINSKLLVKDYYTFTKGDVTIEVSVVDRDENFTYMEIEFPDVETATNYVIPEDIAKFVTKEVTNDTYYKMKNYWARTRLTN